MKTKVYLISALLASASMAFAAPAKPSYNKITLPTEVSNGFYRGSVVFADINADGNMDLCAKGRDLNNGWNTEAFAILTDNTGQFTSKMALPFGDIPYDATLTVFDFNNDGLVDYLFTNYGYQLYRNDGGGKFTKMDNFKLESNLQLQDDDQSTPDVNEQTTEMRYMGLTVAADFNGDGWQDLVVTDADGNPALYTNNGGNGSFTLDANSGLCKQRGGTMAVGDFNKDGYPDLLVNGWSDSTQGDGITINKNMGNGKFIPVTSGNFVGAEKGQAMFVDVDGDGYLDVFVTGESSVEGWNRIAYIFRNNGDETFTKVDAKLSGVSRSGCDWIDVNNDGNMDIVYAGDINDAPNAFIALNNGNMAFTVEDNLVSKARGGAAVAAFDINNTGTPDIAIMGYNDNGDGHFNVWNGLVSHAQNVAPAAPANAVMSEADGKVTFTWDAATDDHTPAAALRYNVYVRLKDGKVITLVPADPETGKLRLGDVNAATTARTYTLNIISDKIADWGVQAIDGGKLASAFTKGTTTGISNIVAGENGLDVTCAGGVITVSADADITVTDIAGRTVLRTKAAAGTPVYANLGAGIYVVKAQAGKDSVAKKVIIR